MSERSHHLVGVSAGDSDKPTGICCLRFVRGASARPTSQPPDDPAVPGTYEVVHIERIKDPSPRTLVSSVYGLFVKKNYGSNDTDLVVDITGTGEPVIEALRQHQRLDPVAVYVTPGTEVSGRGWEYHVARRVLATTVRMLLDAGRIKAYRELSGAEILWRELNGFHAGGEIGQEPWRTGQHDDLILALAVAAWYGEEIAAAEMDGDTERVFREQLEVRPLGDLPY